MKIRTIAIAAATLSLASAPAIAQADLARSLAPVEGESKLGATATVFAILAAAAVTAGVVAAADGGSDDSVSD
ncbi:MAG: hypothetical protein AAFP79_14235 [Pseudomonadota bacterium]